MKTLSQNHAIYSMGSDNPIALWIDEGEIIEIETNNWFNSGRDYALELANNMGGIDINPATGPIGVNGATVGDTLKIKILDINLIEQGLMFSFPGSGVLGENIQKIQTKIIPMKDGYAHFSENIKIPLKPMIGVIGTSPTENIPCYIPGRHGGNMDTQHITAESEIYLPVLSDGGGISIGDLHGVMADGEISEWGLETSGTVKIQVGILKQFQLDWPFLETDTDYYLIVSKDGIEDTIKTVVSYAVHLIQMVTSLSIEDAISLVSLVGHLEVSQIVNPIKTVRMRISKESLGLDFFKKISEQASSD